MFRNEWTYAHWEEGFIANKKPRIEYAELFALATGILTWQDKLTNMRIIVYCHNTSVKDIVNESSGKCKNTMVLVRLLVANNMKHNRRVFAEHISGKNNVLSDNLSRMKIKHFRKLAPHMDPYPRPLPGEIWPPSSIWIDEPK